jgi:hypothetical protein
MLRFLTTLIALAPATAALAQTPAPAEVFQRVCMTGIVDGRNAEAIAAATALGLRQVSDEVDDGGMGRTQTYSGRGYDVEIWGGYWGQGCSVEMPAGVSQASLEAAFVPSLARWQAGEVRGTDREWTRTLPPASSYGPTYFTLSIGVSDGRPYMQVEGS